LRLASTFLKVTLPPLLSLTRPKESHPVQCAAGGTKANASLLLLLLLLLIPSLVLLSMTRSKVSQLFKCTAGGEKSNAPLLLLVLLSSLALFRSTSNGVIKEPTFSFVCAKPRIDEAAVDSVVNRLA
jgi:hypothetical protein